LTYLAPLPEATAGPDSDYDVVGVVSDNSTRANWTSGSHMRVVEVERDQHRLQMFLDTGANASALYPSFLDALGRDENLRLRTKREKLAGAGGVIQRKTEVVPTLGIEVLGRLISLRKLGLLSEAPPGNGPPANRYDCSVGQIEVFTAINCPSRPKIPEQYPLTNPLAGRRHDLGPGSVFRMRIEQTKPRLLPHRKAHRVPPRHRP